MFTIDRQSLSLGWKYPAKTSTDTIYQEILQGCSKKNSLSNSQQKCTVYSHHREGIRACELTVRNRSHAGVGTSGSG